MSSVQSQKSSFQTMFRPVHPLEEIPRARRRSIMISLRAHPKVAAYCFALSLSALLTGYDVVIVGSITGLPLFQKNFGESRGNIPIIPSLWLALWSALTFFGQMIGSILGGWLQDRKGRRPALLLGSSVSAVAIALCYTSDIPVEINARRGLFLAGKIVMGVALGILMSATQTIISELAPPPLRGPVLALIPTNTLLGQLIGAGVVFALSHNPTRWSYLIAIATQWPLSLLIFSIALTTPESPVYLITNGQYSRALRSLARLHTSRVDLPTKLEQVRHFVIHEENFSHAHAYLDCFRPKHRRQTMIVLFAGIIPQLFGLTILSQASYFMQIVGMAPTLSFIVLICGISLGLIANIAGIWTLSKIGRRKLILTSLLASALLWLGMGIAGFWSGQITIWYTAGTLMAVVVVNGLGSWPASFAVAGETSSLLLRAKTQGLNWFTNSLLSGILSIAIPYTFNPDAGNMRAKTGFVFAGLCLVGAMVAWVIVPEMMHRDHAEIEKMFELGVGTRAFKNWSASDDTQELRSM
ncbi:putative sugar transporter [Truncatella angustata]|uniref:Sugar transporter n=1 Tax=Truncatella angustata TaxID=152316 RepID=A0A9P8RKQ4_9PEZI|nr:putative sugar transporter [Truncatella angustata]KAH6647846.1 putative sugar transporter [Truncatella angustata]